jgi:hypothetical protein
MRAEVGPPHERKAAFWLTAVAGWAVIGYGLRGLFDHHIDTRPTNLAKFAIGGALIHDLALAPLVLLVGVFVTRAVGGRWRAIVQTTLIISGCLALFSYPLVRGFGHANHNPTSEPYNYAANLCVVLGAVWSAATIAVLFKMKSSRRPEDRVTD